MERGFDTGEPDAQRLFILTFASPLSAQEALLAAARLGRAGCLVLHDAVLVSRSRDGSFSSVQETRDASSGPSALGRGLLALPVPPGATALALAVSRIDRLAVLDELTRFAGTELYEVDDIQSAKDVLGGNATWATRRSC
jgi:hypothetical protein